MSGDGVIVSGRQVATCFLQSELVSRIAFGFTQRLPDRPNPRPEFPFRSEGNTVLDCFVVTFGSRFQRRFHFFIHGFVELG
jgi:hypothetical protein